MARLSFTQIQQLWIANGGTRYWAPLAAGIAMAESGGTTQAFNTNPSTMDRSVGLWQINYFGQLYTVRSQQYGTPTQLRATPNAQARAAIGLSNNGRSWTPWRTDRTWNAWQAAGAPPQPNATTVQSWLRSAGLTSQVSAIPSGSSTTAATIAAAQATPSTRGLPIPGPGQQYAFRGERTFSIITPSVVPGISATPPTGPHFGDNPIGDLATALRFSTAFGGWALMTATVFLLGTVFLLLGVIMLLGVLFGPVIGPVANVVGPGKFRALNPGNRARRIEQRTRLATAKARRSTRDQADAALARVTRENRDVKRRRTVESGARPSRPRRVRLSTGDTF